jgi:molybdate transport system substrate-binding protein
MTDISVLSSNAIKPAYTELMAQFERASGHKVITVWAGTNDILKRMQANETYDLLILARPTLDNLARDGKVVAGSQVDLVASGIGVAVRAGAPKPDIGTAEALKRALLAAKSIGHSQGPSGVYLVKLFERWGIADTIRSRILQTQPGNPVGEAVARGEAEIGFQQVSELLPIAGITYVGPLPPDIQEVTTFAGGIHTAAKAADAAKAWMTFITAPAAFAAIRKSGMEPAGA